MIEFDCPECGAPMEVKSRMAGRKVRCIDCDRRVRVPDDDDDDDFDRRTRPRGGGVRNDDGLTALEYLLYGALCLSVPGINVLVTSILYYAWQSSQPRRASQINTLGFIIFGFHLICICGFVILTKALKP